MLGLSASHKPGRKTGRREPSQATALPSSQALQIQDTTTGITAHTAWAKLLEPPVGTCVSFSRSMPHKAAYIKIRKVINDKTTKHSDKTQPWKADPNMTQYHHRLDKYKWGLGPRAAGAAAARHPHSSGLARQLLGS